MSHQQKTYVLTCPRSVCQGDEQGCNSAECADPTWKLITHRGFLAWYDRCPARCSDDDLRGTPGRDHRRVCAVLQGRQRVHSQGWSRGPALEPGPGFDRARRAHRARREHGGIDTHHDIGSSAWPQQLSHGLSAWPKTNFRLFPFHVTEGDPVPQPFADLGFGIWKARRGARVVTGIHIYQLQEWECGIQWSLSLPIAGGQLISD